MSALKTVAAKTKATEVMSVALFLSGGEGSAYPKICALRMFSSISWRPLWSVGAWIPSAYLSSSSREVERDSIFAPTPESKLE